MRLKAGMVEEKNGRRLTLPRLREVFAEERIPDSLQDGFPPENRTPSELLQADVKRLSRLIRKSVG